MARRLRILLVVLAVVVFAACGSSSKSSNGASTTTAASPTTSYVYGGSTSPTSAAASTATVLKIAMNAKLHANIIVDASGKTVYLYKPDGTSTTSKVPAALKAAWPPLTTSPGDHGVGDPLSPAKLSANNSNQLAYNHHLLYTFSGDAKPGDANGQGLGKVWYVVSPAGTPGT